MNPITIAIDSGQTAIKVRVDNEEQFSFPGLRANASLLPQLATVVAHVTEQVGDVPTRVQVGTCGLTRRDNDAGEFLRLCQPYGVVEVILTHDAVTSYLGALGVRRGVVLAAGTGAITLGVGADKVARVDGWGNVIGDAGGGYWIGREALDAVHRAHDGRGSATSLAAAVAQRFPDLETAYIELQTDSDWVRIVASFAQRVLELGDDDAVAAAICERAGAELARSVVAAVEQIAQGSEANPVVSLVGGVVRDGPVRAACVRALQEQWPHFAPTAAQGTSLDGAAALSSVAASHPLAARIGRAATLP